MEKVIFLRLNARSNLILLLRALCFEIYEDIYLLMVNDILLKYFEIVLTVIEYQIQGIGLDYKLLDIIPLLLNTVKKIR